ncbi:MAG TPA: SAM-dependent methyltransferase, partial [Candidatus Acidoferrum sp.]|nr:SAM-dependent methyltransferase [Candidatus Acidoferrum sp.]
DALPVHRVEWRDGRLQELFVGAGDTDRPFVGVPGEPSTPALAERFATEGVVLAEGQRAEICLELDAWAATLAPAVDPGFAMVIDYGRTAADLYGPSRLDGTLRAYSGHRAHGDPFVAIGRQDLTAHVDFTAVERALLASGWSTLGMTTQAEFLTGSGLGEILQSHQADPNLSAPGYLAMRASVMRLLDPAALGAFRVLIAGRGVPPATALSGLAYRLRR